MKTCKACGEEKEISDFYPRSGRPDKYHARCKLCELVANKASRTPESRKRSHLRSRFKLELEDTHRLLEEQDGCAVCHTWDSPGRGWCIDHDHACCSGNSSCGKCVRGVLCGLCNTMLGHARDDVDRLLSGAWYLMKKANVRSQQPIGP